uniref:Keratinocyte differentiation associated protein n=1 Tax=Marmota marmota marmota TaxID=9994 RepID=A0A8C5YXS9_MARMA
MKVPVLPAVALLALLALHSTQGASLGSPEVSTEETTIGNYALGPELKGLRNVIPDAQ